MDGQWQALPVPCSDASDPYIASWVLAHLRPLCFFMQFFGWFMLKCRFRSLQGYSSMRMGGLQQGILLVYKEKKSSLSVVMAYFFVRVSRALEIAKIQCPIQVERISLYSTSSSPTKRPMYKFSSCFLKK